MKLKRPNFPRQAYPQADGSLVISPRSIYILPTSFGLVYALLLMLLLVGSINYSNNLGFLLTFFLVGLGLVAMVHTWRNLAGLRLRTSRSEPIFSGQTASFPFHIDINNQRTRPDIELLYADAIAACDTGPGMENSLNLSFSINKRGNFSLGRCTVRSHYPLGLFRAWAYLNPTSNCLVYPKPLSWRQQGGSTSTENPKDGRVRKEISGIDFHGLREYQPGDPLKTIHWKSLAKGLDLMTREFEVPVSSDYWLSWEDTPGPDPESRLGQLCYAALEAAANNTRFGLKLPGKTVPPDDSVHHLDNCLRILALYGLER